ncbi:leucine-rich repeat domain-containing protein [Dapis sp. BLCC M172]
MSQLSNLTTLYLGENQLTKIPESISQLSNLTKLF